MMISLTGIKKGRKHNQKGLSLFEVLVSVVILGTSLIAVYRPLFGSLSALYEAEARLTANRVLCNKIWAFQNEVRLKGKLPPPVGEEAVSESKRIFYYGISSRLLTADKKLYDATATISWQTGAQRKTLVRVIYGNTF